MTDDVKETVSCETCGEATSYTGTKRCTWCYEVETRLEGYLRRGRLRAVRALIDAVSRVLP